MEFIQDEEVRRVLSWEKLVPLIKGGLAALSRKDGSALQPPRLYLPIPQKNAVMLSMPGFSGEENALGCKMVTSFRDNPKANLPSILATIVLFNADTGQLKAVVEGTEITGWRTAAASVVATQHLHRGEKRILAVLGAGFQAKYHIMAFQHVFQFQEVRVWNRTEKRGRDLVDSFDNSQVYKFYAKPEECVDGADVICTTTYAAEPILRKAWLKEGAHINAVGASKNHHSELEDEIYRSSTVVADSIESAQNEVKDLLETGVQVYAELGEIINGTKELPASANTVFQSFGLAIEDVLTANFVYKEHMKNAYTL